MSKIMIWDNSTYYVWVGGSCDYGHKERASGWAYIIQHDGGEIGRGAGADHDTTEFRMILTAMIRVMKDLPEGSDIVFLTNVAYIQNFDKAPTAKSSNADLVTECIELKERHHSVTARIVPYHKYPFLNETHEMAHEAMMKHKQTLFSSK